MQQEAIELCLGQWVGVGLFQWILGGEDEKRLGQGMGDASIADRVLMHRLEQGSLACGRGAGELIGEPQMGEYRAAQKLDVTTTYWKRNGKGQGVAGLGSACGGQINKKKRE